MKTALVIGASRGIGAAIVRALCHDGWRVAFTYRQSEAAARALADETGAAALRCDARDEDATTRTVAEAKRLLAHIDALVYNAGTAWSGLIQDMTCAEWDDLFAVHVRGAFVASRAVLPGMIGRRQGQILFLSSMWGQVGASCEACYSACKAALIGFSKALAKEVGPSGVRVNCIAPGVIQTDMLRGYTPDELRVLADETPLQRLGTPEDIAAAARFLLSDGAAFITGQTIGVNGGFVI